MTITRTSIDVSSEDKILTGMIISTEYLKNILIIYKPEYLNNPYGRTVAQWCTEYYKEYKIAPGLHIQDLFDNQVRHGLDPSTADLIEQFLGRISGEYSKEPFLNPDSMLHDAKELFRSRALKILSEDINAALEQGEDIEDIDNYVADYYATNFDVKGRSFVDSMMTSTELIDAEVKQPQAILWPWLREGSLSMIVAKRGIGKSWLAHIIAVAITRENFRDLTIGPWYVKSQSAVLLVDGEMGNYDLQDRMTQLAKPLGKESRKFPLRIFSAPDYTNDTNEPVNIMASVWQERVLYYLKNNTLTRVLIIDNLSSLGTGRDENDNQAVSYFNEWLVKVRSLGVAVIVIHHAGKSGDQRGASSLEDALNNSIALYKPTDSVQGGPAHFGITFTKARNNSGGDGYKDFALRIIEHDMNPRWRQWIDT